MTGEYGGWGLVTVFSELTWCLYRFVFALEIHSAKPVKTLINNITNIRFVFAARSDHSKLSEAEAVLKL